MNSEKVKRSVNIKFSIKRQKGVSYKESKTLVELDLENDNTKKLDAMGFDDSEIFAFREHYSEDRISDVLDLFEQNIDTVKFPKPWILKSLKKNYVDNTAYKKQFAIAGKIQTKDEIAKEKLKPTITQNLLEH